MASYYVWSGATGSANGSSWANAYTTLTLAYTGKAAGDVFYLAHDHAESSAALVSLTTAGTAVAPTRIVCVNRSGSVPPVSADRRTTAQVATSANFNINLAGGVAHYDGVIFVAGNSTGAASINVPSVSLNNMVFSNCSFRLGSTGAGRVGIGGAGGTYTLAEFDNTTVSFSAVTQAIAVTSKLKWRNTASALIGTAVPTTLFIVGADTALVECVGIDLSAAGSGKTIVSSINTAYAVTFIDCKLNSLVTKATAGSPGFAFGSVDFIRSGATGINYAISQYRLGGTLDHETTIVRSGGATDGVTPLSWKVTTGANSSYSVPFECPVIAIWNDTTGSARTATVEGIWGGGAVPLDSEIWIDVEYLSDASSPICGFVNDGTPDLLTTPANQTSSSATWGGSTTKFKLNVTFTPQMKGWIYARVRCAKPTSTFYIDPLIALT